MAGSLDSLGPSYISAPSADVILSEIRPTKLKIEALHSINVFLDEFLFSILRTAGSLSTDKLRTSLLSLLPTTLGKEALLEAEVELRAYWDRTPTSDASILEDDSNMFHLQWTFELLRLKCVAYSTLNEFDADQAAESRANDRMSVAGGVPPKTALIAPAALYLTAILEALCEHILSNVGRVVARDSSRATATVQDLFTALCEDHTIYDLFKKMKVYEQIEQLSKPFRVRRSKSLTRNEKSSRTSSPQQDVSSIKEPSEAGTNAGSLVTSNSGSRSSLEKTRTMRMFQSKPISRTSGDGDVSNGHKRSNSSLSTAAFIGDNSAYEDDTLQQEFDVLMRSSSTMKVSLTPDRLKTMEVYKLEKERGNRRDPVSESESTPLPPRATGRRPSLLHRVDSIKEDEEESGAKPVPPLPSTRNRQASVSSRPSTAPISSRVRSISTSGSSAALRFFARTSDTSTPALVHPTTTDQSSMQNRHHVTTSQDPSIPPRTRRTQHNRESLDLDEVMAGLDGEEKFAPVPPSKRLAKPATPTRQNTTKDLIDFLAKGPPEMGGTMPDITSDAPPYGTSQNGKSKGTGRLQRMISKLSLGNDRSRGNDGVSRSSQRAIPPQPSSTNSSLPYYPAPLPPLVRRPSPESPHNSYEEHHHTAHSRSATKTSLDAGNDSAPVTVPIVPSSPVPVPIAPSSPIPPEHNGYVSSSRRSQPYSHENGHTQQTQPLDANGHGELQQQQRNTQPVQNTDSSPSPIPFKVQSGSQAPSSTPPVSPMRKPPPVYVEPTPQPHVSHQDALHMHRLFSKATTADECRLILDMFLARAGVLDPKTFDAPHPPSRDQATVVDQHLEASLLELLLGEESTTNSDQKSTQESSQSEALVVVSEMPRGNVKRNSIVGNGESIVTGKDSSIAHQEAAQFAQNHYPVQV